MKKRISAIAAFLLSASILAGCTSPTQTQSTGNTGATSGSTMKKIGIVQLVSHEALDEAHRGFIDGLKEAGYEEGVNIEIDSQNANGEQPTCVTIASKFVNDKADLILAIATPAAQAAANATTDIPILVTAVTDPAEARLVDSNKAPGGNVSGTSDLNPITEQVELLTTLIPDVKTVGLLYNSSEANSKLQIDKAKKEFDKQNIAYIDFTVSSSNEIQSVVESMKDKVDVLYAPTDNLVSSSMAAVASTASALGIPTIVAEPAMVNSGGLATYGIDYYELGKQTGAMAAKVLNGEASPADMPIEYQQEHKLFINESTAETLGISIPEELKEKATLVK